MSNIANPTACCHHGRTICRTMDGCADHPHGEWLNPDSLVAYLCAGAEQAMGGDPTNTARYLRAQLALDAHDRKSDEPTVDRITDLVTNLCHYARANGLLPEDIWETAIDHFYEETGEGGEPGIDEALLGDAILDEDQGQHRVGR